MGRHIHTEELRERQNMRDAAQHSKDGNWCVFGVCDGWQPKLGLQGWGYNKEEAKTVADELDQSDEFEHVTEHRVLTHSEFEELCSEEHIDRDFPWN